MTSKPDDAPQAAELPNPPDLRETPHPMEAWYLECLRVVIAREGGPVTLARFADLVGKSINACYSALRALEGKGYVGRAGSGKGKLDRRFTVIA